MEILEERLPLLDSMMELCYQYLQSVRKETDFVVLLDRTVLDTLDTSNIVLKRDDLSFTRFLLHSNIWFEKYNNQIVI